MSQMDWTKGLERVFSSALLGLLFFGIMLFIPLFLSTFGMLDYDKEKVDLGIMPAFAILLSALIAGLSMQYTISQNRKSKEQDVEDKKKRAKQLLLFYLELLLDELRKQDRFLDNITYYGFGSYEEYRSETLPMFYNDSVKQSIMESISMLGDRDIIGYIDADFIPEVLKVKSFSIDIVHGFDILYRVLEQESGKDRYVQAYSNLSCQVKEAIPRIEAGVRKYKMNERVK